MKKRSFGDVTVEMNNSEVDIYLYCHTCITIREADDLIDNLKSATAWIKDQQRREAEEQTPELPL